MPDERAESIAQGIAPPEESEVGKAAEARRIQELIHAPEHTRPDAAIGGTSDADAPVDDAETARLRDGKG
ncbi:MAG TPA: hypothetical protein VF618_14190 [Thermoanaerobaculia bacterium]